MAFSYEEAMDFLESTKKYGSVPGLDSIRRLMDGLGNPQDSLGIVHIGGTNGKGAVGRMISTVMTEAGYRCGHFATPDVFCYEDEFQINQRMIEKENLADLFFQVRAVCREIVSRGLPHPTRFEVETAAAFLWFAQSKVDLAVIEVGMGGRLDATNLIKKPLLSILTPIGMDHMQFLGDGLADIAAQKAGIIKQGCPVVSQPQEAESMEAIQARCERVNASLTIADAGRARVTAMDGSGTSFSYQPSGAKAGWQDYRIPLAGQFQVDNAVCAIEALHLLRTEYQEAFPNLTDQAICQGLLHTQWPGRFERIGREPDFYIDGAHNPPAAIRLRESIDRYFQGRRVVYIMCVLADKSYEQVARIVFRQGDRVFTLTSPSPRALDGQALADALGAAGLEAQSCARYEQAIDLATRAAGPDGVVVAFGSLSYLGDLRRIYQNRPPVNYVERLLEQEDYLQLQRRIGQLEKDRIYCLHNLSHSLDVCRIAWILFLEDRAGRERGKADAKEQTEKSSREAGRSSREAGEKEKRFLEDWKERIYLTGLLHDVGRCAQYESGEPHAAAGARIARDLLGAIGYPGEKTEEIISVISRHFGRDHKDLISGSLADYICRADQLSRNCFLCRAYDSCKWTGEEKNRTIIV